MRLTLSRWRFIFWSVQHKKVVKKNVYLKYFNYTRYIYIETFSIHLLYIHTTYKNRHQNRTYATYKRRLVFCVYTGLRFLYIFFLVDIEEKTENKKQIFCENFIHFLTNSIIHIHAWYYLIHPYTPLTQIITIQL